MTASPRLPFEVKDCALITLALARAARDLRELRDRVSEVPLPSLYHHFFESMLRPTFDDPELGNDFAIWARDSLRDETLAERLAMLDPFLAGGGDELRAQLVEALEERMSESDIGFVGPVPSGHEFHFLRSQIVVFETGIFARDPEELVALLPELSQGSVFYHFVDARLRPPTGQDDFSAWLARWPGQEAALARLAAIDPAFGSLRDLRRRVVGALADAPGVFA